MRSAISMIELVIAIVVIGIVVASLPLLLQQATSSTTMSVALQESILEAKVQLWRAMARPWDANSYDQANRKAYILNTTSQHEQLQDRNGTTGYSGRRSVHPAGTNAVLENAFITAANMNAARAIENFNNFSINLLESGKILPTLRSAGEVDYIMRDATVTTIVRYMDDRFRIGGVDVDFNAQEINNIQLDPASFAAPLHQSSNIKIISATADTNVDLDGDGVDEQAVLHVFASNVGESQLPEVREYIP